MSDVLQLALSDDKGNIIFTNLGKIRFTSIG